MTEINSCVTFRQKFMGRAFLFTRAQTRQQFTPRKQHHNHQHPTTTTTATLFLF